MSSILEVLKRKGWLHKYDCNCRERELEFVGVRKPEKMRKKRHMSSKGASEVGFESDWRERGEEGWKWRLSVLEGVSWRCQSHIMAAWQVLLKWIWKIEIMLENTEDRGFLYKCKRMYINIQMSNINISLIVIILIMAAYQLLYKAWKKTSTKHV